VLGKVFQALRWAYLVLKFIPMAKYIYRESTLIYAISRAEYEQIRGKSNLSDGIDKKKRARELLKKFSCFKNKNATELNKLIESAWRFMYSKEE
jgi:hypothetical protein